MKEKVNEEYEPKGTNAIVAKRAARRRTLGLSGSMAEIEKSSTNSRDEYHTGGSVP